VTLDSHYQSAERWPRTDGCTLILVPLATAEVLIWIHTARAGARCSTWNWIPNTLLRLTWARDASITEADAEAAMEKVNVLCGQNRHPMLVDMATTADVSRGARAVFGRPVPGFKDRAARFVSGGPGDGQLFLGINKLPCPTRFFTSEADALAWLKVS
jgi:hypothetical protein